MLEYDEIWKRKEDCRRAGLSVVIMVRGQVIAISTAMALAKVETMSIKAERRLLIYTG